MERWTRSTRERSDARNAREMLAMLEISAALLRAQAASSAVRSVVQLTFQRLRIPIAGLLPDRSGTGWFVVAARGIGPRRGEIGRAIAGVSAARPGRATRDRLAARVAAVSTRGRIEAVAAGEAVLLAADLRSGDRAFVKAVGSLLDENLLQLRTVQWARMRTESLDLALAWTAHELRGPLVGARAALGLVRVDARESQSRELLRQSRDELGQLAELVDPLLHWSTGSTTLRKRCVDLFEVVDGCVTSCQREASEGNIVLVGSIGTRVSADARQLRVAVSNVIRNALAYSPSGSAVTVTVDGVDGYGRVRVRDRGPGVPAEERQLIFDPFARGHVGGASRSGAGLGLFIASRIVEAHEGTIGLRAARPGTEFHVELPLAEQGRIRSAS
jgi:two-component system, OmpR family, sensor kinase